MARKIVQKIKQHLTNGEFRYSIHCESTADDRIVTYNDICHVGKTLHTAKLQSNGSYMIVGFDEQDMELKVICRLLIKSGVLIITVY